MKTKILLVASSLLSFAPGVAYAVAGAPFVNMPSAHVKSSEAFPHLFVLAVIVLLAVYLAVVPNSKH